MARGTVTARRSTAALLLAHAAVTVHAQSAAFKGCAVPSFEWATYGNDIAAMGKLRRGAVAGGYVYAAGNVRSNTNADVEEDASDAEFALTGPYSVADPTGQNAATITADVRSYPESEGFSENAGGSFGQYDVGVVRIAAATGVPEAVLVVGGDGMDETTGLAARGDAVVVSGHFAGHLTAELGDGTAKTIWNSNVGEGGAADDADQFHPNNKNGAGHTGVDDGFVIKMNAALDSVEWMTHYPQSNRDSQIVTVDLDDDDNVFGSGYRCTLAEGAEAKVCDGLVAMFDARTGAVLWEKSFNDTGALFFVKWDAEDGGLYVAGTTTYGGGAPGAKDHGHCADDTCSVVMRLDARDGGARWVRTIQGSPRWGNSDQCGGVALANQERDGPFLYVALDDTGEGDAGEASLHRGTPYGGCLSENGTFTPEVHAAFLDKVVTQEDCDAYDAAGASVYVSREDPRARPASSIARNVTCGGAGGGADACLMKYHKHTGLPLWAVDVPPVAALVPAADGAAVHIAGSYGGGGASFGGVALPGYQRVGGLGSQTTGMYNAKIGAEDGRGEYVIHSGGGSKDKVTDMVGDPDGNLYNIGFNMNLVTQWGGNLQTTVVERGVAPEDATSEAEKSHMYVSKLAAATQETPSCLTTCAGNTDDAVVDASSCFIDGKCYAAGEDGHAFGKKCFACDPTASQREWTEGPAFGRTQCFVDNKCLDAGEAFFYQRRSWSAKIFSDCQVCDPEQNAQAWTVRDGFVVDASKSPPDDCMSIATTADAMGNSSGLTGEPTSAPIEPVVTSPPTLPPVAESTVVEWDLKEEPATSRPTQKPVTQRPAPAEPVDVPVTALADDASACVGFSPRTISGIMSVLVLPLLSAGL